MVLTRCVQRILAASQIIQQVKHQYSKAARITFCCLFSLVFQAFSVPFFVVSTPTCWSLREVTSCRKSESAFRGGQCMPWLSKKGRICSLGPWYTILPAVQLQRCHSQIRRMLEGSRGWLQPVQPHHRKAAGHAAEVIGRTLAQCMMPLL